VGLGGAQIHGAIGAVGKSAYRSHHANRFPLEIGQAWGGTGQNNLGRGAAARFLSKTHIAAVQRLFDLLNAGVPNPILVKDLGLLRTDVLPVFGSARIDERILRSLAPGFSAGPELPDSATS